MCERNKQTRAKHDEADVMDHGNVILVPWGKYNFDTISELWGQGYTAKTIARDSGYSETVIKMILKRVVKIAPVGK